MKRFYKLAAACTVMMLGSTVSHATTFPERTISWIVPYAAGGGTDVVARAVAHQMSSELGQTIIVENRPGAATTIGASAIAKSKNDGYTIGTADIGTLALNRHLMPTLTYDPLHDFDFVGGIANFPYILVAHPSVPANNLEEVLALAKKKPGSLAYGTSGMGGGAHVAMELLQQRTGTELLFVPYRGAAPVMQDLLAGQIQLAMVDTGSSMQHIKAGTVRAIAVSMENRLASLPDLPTFNEAGVPDFVAYSWQGLIAPRSLPEDVKSRLAEALEAALSSDKVKKTLGAIGVEPAPQSGADFKSFARQQDTLWGDVIEKANIKLE